MASDAGDYSVLVLLDLSAASDTVDHCTLINRLYSLAGISRLALDWLSSYLYDRSFSVSIGSYMSDSIPLSCGVPQGSVLGLGIVWGVRYRCQIDTFKIAPVPKHA